MSLELALVDESKEISLYEKTVYYYIIKGLTCILKTISPSIVFLNDALKTLVNRFYIVKSCISWVISDM